MKATRERPLAFGMAAATTLATTLVLVTSCIKENVVGTTDDTPADTVYSRDTLLVHDTVTRHDTTVVRDTSWLPQGRTGSTYFGIVYDISDYDTLDSAHTELVAFSNPRREDLTVRVNSRALPYGETTPRDVFFDAATLDMFALLQSAIYEGSVPSAARYQYVVLTPVYPTDTTEPVTYDTVKGETTVPASLLPLVLTGPDSAYRAEKDTAYLEYAFSFAYDDDSLVLSWRNRADFYAVYVEKVYSSYFGSEVVGEPIRTFSVDTQLTLTGEFLYQDSLTPVNETYSYLWVDIQPIMGPRPSTWDTLPSFGSRGLLLGLRYEPYSTYMVPVDPNQPLVKRRHSQGRHGSPRRPEDDLAGLRRLIDRPW